MKIHKIKMKIIGATILLGAVFVTTIYWAGASKTEFDAVLRQRESSKLPIVNTKLIHSEDSENGTWVYSLSEFRGGEVLFYTDYIVKNIIGYEWEDGSGHATTYNIVPREMDFSAQNIAGNLKRTPLLMGIVRNEDIKNISVSLSSVPPYKKYTAGDVYEVNIFEKEGFEDRYYYVDFEDIDNEERLIFDVSFKDGSKKEYLADDKYDVKNIQKGYQIYLYPAYDSEEELIVGNWKSGTREDEDFIIKYDFFEDGTYKSYYEKLTDFKTFGEVSGLWEIKNSLLVVTPENGELVEVEYESLEEVNKRFYGIHLFIGPDGIYKVTDEPSDN